MGMTKRCPKPFEIYTAENKQISKSGDQKTFGYRGLGYVGGVIDLFMIGYQPVAIRKRAETRGMVTDTSKYGKKRGEINETTRTR